MRFQTHDRVEWTSRSGILRRGEVVEALSGGQWAVRVDGCSVEHAVDGAALSLEGITQEPTRPRPATREPLTPEQRSERARHAALSTSPEHRRERSRKAGLASARKAGKRIGPKPKPVPRPAPKPIQHGTANGYRKRGCRCVACRAAHRAYIKDYFQRRKAKAQAEPETIQHGTTYGYAIGCRCEACCAVKAAAKRKHRRATG